MTKPSSTKTKAKASSSKKKTPGDVSKKGKGKPYPKVAIQVANAATASVCEDCSIKFEPAQVKISVGKKKWHTNCFAGNSFELKRFYANHPDAKTDGFKKVPGYEKLSVDAQKAIDKDLADPALEEGEEEEEEGGGSEK